MRQPALGVQRAVDRIDDHEQVRREPKSTTPRSSLTAVKRAPASYSACSSAKTTSSAAWSISSVRSPPSPRVPVSITRSAIVGLVGEHRADRGRRPPARTEPVGCVSGGFGGHPRPILRRCLVLTSAQREAVEHAGGPLLVLGGAGTGKTTVVVERFALARRARARRSRVLGLTLGDAPPTRCASSVEDRIDRALRGALGHDVPGPVRAAAARRGAGGRARPVRDAGRAPPTGWRCCSSASTSCRCATTTCAATRARRSARSSAAIDRLKDELITRRRLRAPGRPRCPRTRAARASASSPSSSPPTTGCSARPGALDVGDLVLHAFRLLREKPHVRARLRRATPHVLVDELQDASFAQGLLLRLLVAEHGGITAFADDDQAIHRFRGAATKNIRDFRAEWPLATVVRLEESQRSGAPPARRGRRRGRADRRTGSTRRSRGRRAPRRRGRVLALRVRARAGAGRGGRGRAAGRARGRRARGRVRARALRARARARRSRSRFEERAVPYHLSGAAAFFQRAEVRDLLAWLRLLVDPGDAGAVVRALARPPVELRAIDLARVTQIARRRKLDMVAALCAPRWSRRRSRPRRASGSSPSSSSTAARPARWTPRGPDLYVHRLIERLGLRRQLLFAATTEVVERLRNLARFAELAAAYVRRAPAGHRARVRPLDRRRRRRRPARGGGRRRRARRAACG